MNHHQREEERKQFIESVMFYNQLYDLRYDSNRQLFVSWETEERWQTWLRRSRIAVAEREALQTENRELKEWRESAITILGEWDSVFEALGSTGYVGQSKAQASRVEATRLRQRLAELAQRMIRRLIRTVREKYGQNSRDCWVLRSPETTRLAEEAGCWYNDSMQEVPLEKWKERNDP